MSFEAQATDNFQCSFVDFCFIIITKVLMNELERMLIDHLNFLDFWVFFKMLLTVCPVIVDKELWTWLWSSNFQNSTFQKITITVTDVDHMQVYFMAFGSKQKIKKIHNTVPSSYLLKTGLLKTSESRFALVSVQGFSVNYSRATSVDVQCLHKNGKRVICISNGDYTLFKERSCCSTLFHQNTSRHLRFSKLQQILLLLPRIKSRWYLLAWSGKSFLSSYLLPNQRKSHAYPSDWQYSTCLIEKALLF